MKIKAGDTVLVTAGKDKGKTGEVLRTMVKTGRIVVEGVNVHKKHVKPSNNNKGGIIPFEASMDISNLKVICPNCEKASRIGYTISKDKKKERLCKKCKQAIPDDIKKK